MFALSFSSFFFSLALLVDAMIFFRLNIFSVLRRKCRKRIFQLLKLQMKKHSDKKTATEFKEADLTLICHVKDFMLVRCLPSFSSKQVITLNSWIICVVSALIRRNGIFIFSMPENVEWLLKAITLCDTFSLKACKAKRNRIFILFFKGRKLFCYGHFPPQTTIRCKLKRHLHVEALLFHYLTSTSFPVHFRISSTGENMIS